MTEAVTCHIPVLRKEVLAYLQVSKGGNFLDCTLGGGGHTEAMLQTAEQVRVVAVDRDLRAIERARVRLAPYADRVTFYHFPFSRIKHEIKGPFNGVLADLGISSDQLQEERGFSFKDEALLDMRMDESQRKTAATVVNDYSERELRQALQRGGCSKEAAAVARALVRARPVKTTRELTGIVDSVMRGRKPGKNVSPATVVFQAIRIEVNDEFKEIRELLAALPSLVIPGGRAAVISFHSLEDRIIAGTMRDWQGRDTPPATDPRSLTVRSMGKLLTSKAVVPDEEESEANRRARSARMRVFEFGTEKT